MAEDLTRTGRCLCGAVTFTVELKAAHFDACHCGMCRRWSGGPAFAVEAKAAPAIDGADKLASYSSSDWGVREFCSTCGSNLFWRSPQFGIASVYLGALDNADDLTFETQIFVDHKLPGYSFAEQTQMMTEAEVVAQFSGPHDD